MAIDLQSLSITSAFNSIVNYFRSQENNSAFRDLTNGSEGSFLIRMLANVMSVISYRIVAQSRENYLSTAALPASNIGIAVNLGYSVPRGSNLKRLVKLTPNGNYTLPKFSVLGSYSTEYSILTLKEYSLVEGQPIEMETVVGNLREESFVTGTSDIKIFTLFNSNISDDFMLFKDNIEVPTTTNLKEMLDNKYLVRTNPYSSVDIAFLNTLETADENYKYGNGTEITIRYVELANVPVVPYSSSMFNYGTLNDYRTLQGNRGMETVESMKVTAPLYHEVQNLIRSKADYASALRINVPSVNEVNFKALTPTYTQITYLKDNFNLLTGTYQNVGSSQENKEALESTEVGLFQNLLRDQNYFGTPLPDIVVPRREVANLHISIALKNKYKNISDINYDVENILKNYYDTYLNVTFNTYELERKIEELSYVKYARVEHVVNEREANTYYQMGYLTYNEDTGSFYRVSNIVDTAGGSPDNWASQIIVGSDIDTNAVIQDGNLFWKCYKRLPEYKDFKIKKRYDYRTYGIGDFVYVNDETLKDLMFKCVDVYRQSGGTKPDVTTSELGDFIEDGGIIWVIIDRVSDPTVPEWESYKNYRLGQRVNGVGDYFSLECVSYAGRADSNKTPTFFQSSFDIVPDISGEQETDAVVTVAVEGDQRAYFQYGDAVKVEYKENNPDATIQDWETSVGRLPSEPSRDIGSRVVTTTEGKKYTIIALNRGQLTFSVTFTKIYPAERPTIDGQLEWEIVEDPTKIQYPWDSFVTFKHEVEIVGD